jgi:hypothetical protein
MNKYRRKLSKDDFVLAELYTGHNGWLIEEDFKGVIESPVLEPTDDNPSGHYLQIAGNITVTPGNYAVQCSNGDIKGISAKDFESQFDIQGKIDPPDKLGTTTIRNYEVLSADYVYCAHYRYAEIRLLFENCCININPSHGNNLFNLYDLFNVFGIDSEDGVGISKITGKYCRIVCNGDKITEIRHITDNSKVYEIV